MYILGLTTIDFLSFTRCNQQKEVIEPGATQIKLFNTVSKRAFSNLSKNQVCDDYPPQVTDEENLWDLDSVVCWAPTNTHWKMEDSCPECWTSPHHVRHLCICPVHLTDKHVDTSGSVAGTSGNNKRAQLSGWWKPWIARLRSTIQNTNSNTNPSPQIFSISNQ